MIGLVTSTSLFAVLAGEAEPGAHARPSLRPLTLSPLRLQGSGFRGGERVRIELAVGKVRAERRTVANATGTVTADFGLVALDPCPGEALVVRAVGESGRSATFKRLCRRAHRVGADGARVG